MWPVARKTAPPGGAILEQADPRYLATPCPPVRKSSDALAGSSPPLPAPYFKSRGLLGAEWCGEQRRSKVGDMSPQQLLNGLEVEREPSAV